MLNATQAFLDTLERWVKAVREDNFDAARICTRQLIRDGELLTAHPDFQKCFTTHSAGSDPRQALTELCHFLLCATDGRATMLKKFVCDGQRSPTSGPASGPGSGAGAGPASGPALP